MQLYICRTGLLGVANVVKPSQGNLDSEGTSSSYNGNPVHSEDISFLEKLSNLDGFHFRNPIWLNHRTGVELQVLAVLGAYTTLRPRVRL